MGENSSYTDEIMMNNEFQKRVLEAFEIFDYSGNKIIDIREIPSVLCYMGYVPTKTEIDRILESSQDLENPGNIHLSKFIPLASSFISKYKFYPASAEELLKAFYKLDTENRGYLTSDFVSKILTQEGEYFTLEEINNMLSIAVDKKSGYIYYKRYINYLMQE